MRNSDNPSTVPAHWTKVTINDIGSYVNGVAFKEVDWHDSGLPIIRIQNLTDTNKPFNTTKREVRADSRIDNGDILVSWSATLDAFRWNRGPAVLNQHIFKVLPHHDRVRDQFLFYLLKEAIAEMGMSAHAHGSTMKHINRGPFLAHEVYLPPIGEQRQIIEAIETQFARLDDAVASLKRARTRIKRYRASVLKAACEGRLVPTEAELARQEGRGYEPASVLLERIRGERAAAPGKKRGKAKTTAALNTAALPALPEGWAWTPFGELLREPLRNGHSAKTSPDGNGLPTISLTAVTVGDFSGRNVKMTVADARKVHDLWMEPGDILIQRSNTADLVGTARLFRGPSGFAIFPDLLIRARLSAQVDDRFFEVVLKSNVSRYYFRRKAQGISGSMPKISQETIEELPVPLPCFAEQERIVAEVERRLSFIEQMEATVETNLKRAGSLRQSILRMAFSGRLVAMDQAP